MSRSQPAAAATAPATPEPAPACEAAPLPSQAGYIDEDGTFYPGYIEGDARSDCSDADSLSDVGPSSSAHAYDDDDMFVQKVRTNANNTKTAERSVSRARAKRPDIYSLRLMPAEAYQAIPPPPVPVFGTSDQPMTEAAAGDVGDALLHDVDYDDGAAVADPYNYQHHHDHDSYHHGGYYGAGEEGAADYAPRPSRRGAAQPAPAGVMCCYFKQGHCHMGDQCWYAHEGTAETPCHYGAKCRKGHKNLVRSNAAPPMPKDNAARHQQQQQNPAGPVPKRYVHEPKPTKSAPLVDSDMPCPYCEEEGKVRLQDFPLFEGHRVRQATRGHCGGCLRTFMLQ